ncbi:aquaporin-9 [Platysternon megacephalum]|uniref:Aquaporin-9 n=1 Tax=Platysternon megacephalum TaxID=55544 RepID=A0A4D9E676_9SAUR|nr:aquaporin-9 [Platysternon megacephalum]
MCKRGPGSHTTPGPGPSRPPLRFLLGPRAPEPLPAELRGGLALPGLQPRHPPVEPQPSADTCLGPSACLWTKPPAGTRLSCIYPSNPHPDSPPGPGPGRGYARARRRCVDLNSADRPPPAIAAGSSCPGTASGRRGALLFLLPILSMWLRARSVYRVW